MPSKRSEQPTPIELEAAIFRQEHRLYPLLKNFWKRNCYAVDDPRHDAIVSALLWRIVIALMPTFAATSVGFAGIAGIWLAWQANGLIEEQNKFFKQQNDYFNQQNKLIVGQFEASERTELLQSLYETNRPSQIEKMLGYEPTPVSTVRSRSEALRAFLKLERKTTDRIDLTEVQLSNANLQNVDFRGVVLTKAILDGADLYEANLSGVFLNRAKLRKANLENTLLVNAELQGANLEGALIAGDLTNADLTNADLRNARLNGANICGTHFDGSDLAGADFDNSYVSSLDWIDRLTKLEEPFNVKNFNPEEWEVVDNGTSGSPDRSFTVRRIKP